MRTNSITVNHKGNCPETPKVWKIGSGKEAMKIPPHTVLEYDFWSFGGGFISMLLVHEDYRRRGIGSELMKYAENKCRKEKLFTSTNQSNKPMQSLLKKLKYERSGTIHNLDPGDPELIYFKKVTLNK